MRYGHLPALGKPVSRLVQGTPMLSMARLEEGFRLLDEVYASGCTAFDTARTYCFGESEQVLGRWIEARHLRDHVVVIGKGGHPRDGVARVTPADVTDDLLESLRQLRVEQIDLYLLHRDNPAVGVAPIIDFLNDHVRAGRIGAFGASNWSHERIAEANAYAEASGQLPFAAGSVHFSLAVPSAPPWPGCLSVAGFDQAPARAWYCATSFPLLAWSSLCGGFLSGRFWRGVAVEQFTDPADRRVVDAYCHEENLSRLDRARRLAGERGMTVPQIAIGYVLSSPMDVYALVGSAGGAEFDSLVAGMGLQLSRDEICWLESGETAGPA